MQAPGLQPLSRAGHNFCLTTSAVAVSVPAQTSLLALGAFTDSATPYACNQDVQYNLHMLLQCMQSCAIWHTAHMLALDAGCKLAQCTVA